jgi:HK97 family phage prohead protease
MEQKDIRFEIKNVDESGTFEGFAATYGNEDLGGDVIEPGAFARTLKNSNGETRILWQHDTTRPIGKATLTDTKEGLHIKGKLALAVTAGRDAYESVKARLVDGLSIGYDAVRKEMKDGRRHLQEIKLFEVSLVTFPMNPAALVTSVKSETDDSDLREILTAMRSMREDYNARR